MAALLLLSVEVKVSNPAVPKAISVPPDTLVTAEFPSDYIVFFLETDENEVEFETRLTSYGPYYGKKIWGAKFLGEKFTLKITNPTSKYQSVMWGCSPINATEDEKSFDKNLSYYPFGETVASQLSSYITSDSDPFELYDPIIIRHGYNVEEKSTKIMKTIWMIITGIFLLIGCIGVIIDLCYIWKDGIGHDLHDKIDKYKPKKQNETTADVVDA